MHFRVYRPVMQKWPSFGEAFFIRVILTTDRDGSYMVLFLYFQSIPFIMTNQKKRIFLLFILLSFFTGISSILAQSDLQRIKERVIKELMKPSVDDTEVTNLLETIQPNIAAWPGISAIRTFPGRDFEHRYHLANMVKLAHAYQFKKSRFFHKKMSDKPSNWL
ncbi:MAG: hypothetical protein R3B93_18910 [Bacteroidia bacterium]